MKNNRSAYATVTAVVLSVAALGFTSAAQAHVDVSVGIGIPGLAIGVPEPVYVTPPPVYYEPAPVYVRPRRYYAPPPMIVAPYPVYRADWARPGYEGDGWHRREESRKHHWRDRDHDHRDHGDQDDDH